MSPAGVMKGGQIVAAALCAMRACLKTRGAAKGAGECWVVSATDNQRHARDLEAYRIGKRIAQARRAAGLTQRDLAGKLGCVHQTLARYEAGELTLAVVTLLQIARVLGVSSHQLIDEPPSLAAGGLGEKPRTGTNRPAG